MLKLRRVNNHQSGRPSAHSGIAGLFGKNGRVIKNGRGRFRKFGKKNGQGRQQKRLRYRNDKGTKGAIFNTPALVVNVRTSGIVGDFANGVFRVMMMGQKDVGCLNRP